MKKIFKFIFTSFPLVTASSMAISCGRNVDTPEKIEQEQLFSSSNSKEKIETLWLETTLKKINNVELNTDLLENSDFVQKAFQAYSTYVDFKNQSDSLYMSKEVNKLLSDGSLSSSEINTLNTLTLKYKSTPNIEQFKILFKNELSNVKTQTLKLLLVSSYFDLSKEEEIKKVANDLYTKNKDNFDLKNYLLIDYLVDKKLVQLWEYSDKNTSDLFTSSHRIISNLNDYNNIALQTYSEDKFISQNLLLTNNSFETKMFGYQGIKNISFNLDNSINTLKQIKNASDYSGFYDYENNKLIQVNDNMNLITPIKITNNNSSIQIAYINRLLPIGKLITVDNPDKDKEGQPNRIQKTILTLENTPFMNNLIKLQVLLFLNDDTLYNKALDAFVMLGYKFVILNNTLKKSLEGVKYID
ncbi:HinT-interacting membrane complex lipoprotein P60 [Mycoplasmopsis felis]|uniref:HinT-interacting membrane complex lipoprotein P60 n=1 Tax=Mycoplasmopsis felis TaxID=33923 RepID=UPI003A4D5A41